MTTADRSRTELPTGTITFLRTDLEGSMELTRALGSQYDTLNDEHHAIVRAAADRHGGHVVRTEGDAFFIVFTEALAAARAAVDIQVGMDSHPWPDGRRLRTRIGLHAGVAYAAGDDYGGIEVSRAARIAGLGWGGQTVLSDPVRALIAPALPAGWAVRDLGLHRLKGVADAERIYQLEAPGLDAEFSPLRSRTDPADRLPERMTTFVGRQPELDALGDLLAATRLLTLTGPGGSGKTTLALELARRHAAELEDGAWFVDLQAIRDEQLVRGEVARGLGLHDGPTGPAADRLEAYVRDRALLVVIDNFEQVIGAASVVGDLLVASPRSKAIVTSRRALKLRAEQEYMVRPMRVEQADDDAGYAEAVRLFIDRARRVRPDLDPGPAALEASEGICRLVDGLPLAIELCAARVASLPFETIRDRLRAHQPLPGSGPRDLPDRQRTIETTVAWSYDLLDPSLRRLFARLASFEESFDHAQAESVAGPADELGTDTLDGLVRLTEHSLLTRVDDAVGGIRFGWLETIHEHARARLRDSGEEPIISDRHARAYAGLAQDMARFLPGAKQGRAIDRLQADEANLRAAIGHALETGDVETALLLVASLWRYWLQTGRIAEGRVLVDRALALPGADAPTPLRVRALDAAGGIAYWSGEEPRADALYQTELAIAEAIGDRAGEALALFDLSFTRVDSDPGFAEAARQRSESIMRELGDTFGVQRSKGAARFLLMRGFAMDPETLQRVEVAAREAEALDDPWLSRTAALFRAFIAFVGGDVVEATRLLVRSVSANLHVRERSDAALALQFAVIAAPMLGRPDLAATIHGAAEAALEQLGIVSPWTYQDVVGSDPIPALREAIGAGAFDAAVASGRRMSLEEAVDAISEAVDPTPEPAP